MWLVIIGILPGHWNPQSVWGILLLGAYLRILKEKVTLFKAGK